MSRLKKTIATASLASIYLTGLAFAQTAEVGQPAPAFGVMGLDGKQIFLKDMEAQGAPIFIYFIDQGDGVSSQASNYINRIVRAYTPSPTKWFGVINVGPEAARSYSAEFNPPYALYVDTKLTSMQMFKAQSSPTIVEIDGKGKVTHIWQGLSGAMMKSLNRAVAAANGKKPARLDFSTLPSTTQFGSPFIKAPGGGSR